MPMHWKLVSYEVPDEDDMEKIRLKAAQFPPGVLDNVPTDFLFRAVWSSQAQGCVVLCYQDGAEPDIDQITGVQGSYPTYKGMQGKRVSFIAATGTDPGPGAVIKVTCKHRLCINQQHLEYGGKTRNQYTKTEDPNEQL